MDTIKTYKREVSASLIVFWAIITAKMFFNTPVELIVALTPLYTTVTTMIVPPSLMVFCYDFYMKKKNASPSS